VLEWIGVMNTTVLTAGTAPNVTSRIVALVSASVFDAVNGIDPRYRPLLVKPNAPHGASQRAAAIQAAYVMLLHVYPLQSGTLATQRNASLTALASTEKAQSIDAGVAWGKLLRMPFGPHGSATGSRRRRLRSLECLASSEHRVPGLLAPHAAG